MPIAFTVLFSLLQVPSSAEWPQFRGGEGNNVVADLEHPRQWGPDQNVAWTIEVPGSGWSSPIVVGDRFFVTSAVAEDDRGPKGFQGGVQAPETRGRGAAKPEAAVRFDVSCYALEGGELLWTKTLAELVPEYGVHPSNTYATESPVTDGERVFATFGALGEVVAHDLDGEELWRVATGVFPTSNDFGWGSALTAADGLVFVQSDNEQSSFVLALDGVTGEERWRVDRGRGTCWSSPVLWRHGERDELVTCGPGYVTAYAPVDGSVLWRLDGLGGSFSSSPTCVGDRLFFGNSGPGSRGPLVAVRAGASGSHRLTRSEDPEIVEWRADRAGPGFPSPVAFDRYLYVIGSMGVLACFDAVTGDRLYRQRLPDSSTVVATPWTDGEELFVLDEQGKTFVVAVGPEFELLRVNELPGLHWSTPSVAGKNLLIRSATGITCVRSRP